MRDQQPQDHPGPVYAFTGARRLRETQKLLESLTASPDGCAYAYGSYLNQLFPRDPTPDCDWGQFAPNGLYVIRKGAEGNVQTALALAVCQSPQQFSEAKPHWRDHLIQAEQQWES